MRQSQLGSHIAGEGTYLAFIEEIEMYRDYKEYNVRMPHSNPDDWEKMSGECKIVKIGDI